jgi:hypothetical protein
MMEVVATTMLYDVSGIFWQGRMHSSFLDGSSEDNQVSGTLSGVVAGEITIKECGEGPRGKDCWHDFERLHEMGGCPVNFLHLSTAPR